MSEEKQIDIQALQTELELLRSSFHEELERQKLDALAEFAAGAGHEINNPLAIIGGYAQMMLREIDHPEHCRQLAVIAAQVRRAYEMIADIRFFARPPEPEKTSYDIIADMQKLVEEQTPAMQEHGIELHFATNQPSGQPLYLHTDPILLHVAVGILCNNARESLQETGGRIQLQLNRNETGCVEISVQDNGIGVDEEIRPLIFCPYFSGRQAGRGLGFGLPKVWRIMEKLDGSIRHEKPESHDPERPGARFVLNLRNAVVR